MSPQPPPQQDLLQRLLSFLMGQGALQKAGGAPSPSAPPQQTAPQNYDYVMASIKQMQAAEEEKKRKAMEIGRQALMGPRKK
jgi:hypothetical protein